MQVRKGRGGTSGTSLGPCAESELLPVASHVALTPVRGFGMRTAETHVRLSYAASTDDLHEGVTRLRAFVAALQ